MIYQKLYPGGKAKAVTFSYDDGVEQDAVLAELFNRYGARATFNLNSGIGPDQSWDCRGVTVRRLPPEDMPGIYDGHEIACHSRTHPHLEELPVRALYEELLEDRIALGERFRCKVTGLALPYGSWNGAVMEAVEKLGFLYCRTTESTGRFSLPENFLRWNPTCHHNDPQLMLLAESFRVCEEELPLFYIWGHAYEFAVDNNWGRMEELLDFLAAQRGIWYATNHAVAAYLRAASRLVAGEDFFYNPTNQDLWVRYEGSTLKIPAGEWLDV